MRRDSYKFAGVIMGLLLAGCVPALKNQQIPREPDKSVPADWGAPADERNSAAADWHTFFTDPNVVSLIEDALQRNQELNIALQEILVADSEVLARSGEYLPNLDLELGGGVEKPGQFTSLGAVDENLEIERGKEIPNPMTNLFFGVRTSWEIDIWKKLRNATHSAKLRYLASIEGRNYMATKLIAEIASSYYELMALDNQLEVLKQNLQLQVDGLKIVRLEKQAARVTELAVKRFEAEVLKNQSKQFEIHQQIVVTENRLNFLVGRFPQPVERSSTGFTALVPTVVNGGVPTQMLENRPDVRRAELELQASKLDVKVARALFYPRLSVDAGIGYDAYSVSHMVTTPESLAYNLTGNLIAPLLNRRAISARYFAANAKQMQAVVNYEKTVLAAYAETANQLAMIDNLGQSYSLRAQQVEKLVESIQISNTLFKSARADYLEVLTTRRDALESQMELIETKKLQLTAVVNVYQALGGGWRDAMPEPEKN